MREKGQENRLTIHVVSHTHWDREWYRTAAVFRQRFVPLLDAVLNAAGADKDFSFLVDGQAVLLEDYLEVRPEQRHTVSQLLRSGAIEAGPSFVLADALIPSGELLTRNLLAGRAALRTLEAPDARVLYCPDSFGHPAALPTIAAQFGCNVIVLWRGFGGARHPGTSAFLWRAPDGATVLVHHLPKAGYEFGANLPTERGAAARFWSEIFEELRTRAQPGPVLLTNGADHHALQEHRREAIAALREAAAPHRVLESSLSRFGADLRRIAVSESHPVVQGELRDSYGYTWALQGTFATRSRQKRTFNRAARKLIRDADAWCALAHMAGNTSALPLLRAAWRPLLLCMPHDTLCGCSIDAVAREASARIRTSFEQASHLTRAALEWLAGYDRNEIRERDYSQGKDCILIYNSVPRPRAGVAHVSVVTRTRDVRVGPGSAVQPQGLSHLPLDPLQLFGTGDGASVIQPVVSRTRYDLIEASRHYPDCDVVVDHKILMWHPGVPGYGFEALPVPPAAQTTGGPRHPAYVLGDAISNGVVSGGVTREGRVWLAARGVAAHTNRGSSLRDRFQISVEDAPDSGDLYTPSVRAPQDVFNRAIEWEIIERGPLRAALRVRFPVLEVTLSVSADSPYLALACDWLNLKKDHRLRLVISGNMRGVRTFAEAAFSVVERVLPEVAIQHRVLETPPSTQPLHRYVTLLAKRGGMTLISDGASEYESDGNGQLAITLLRAVGQLSKPDIPERPGNAGWPAATPLAQELGKHRASFAWLPHRKSDWNLVAADVEKAADDFLHPLRGFTLRSASSVPESFEGLELEGDGLAFATLKESEDGAWLVLRCVNLTDRSVAGAWRLGLGVSEACMSRLDETALAPIGVQDARRISFVAAPHEVTTILVRRVSSDPRH